MKKGFFVLLLSDDGSVAGVWNRSWRDFLPPGQTRMGTAAYDELASAVRAARVLRKKMGGLNVVVSMSSTIILTPPDIAA